MAIFTLSSEEMKKYDAFEKNVNQIITRLLIPGVSDTDTAELKRFAARFTSKVSDFFDKERRLNIGIVGQVKAGKSSFLNTLLFDGKSVLPKASTPKTATLTKIEYAENNVLEIEYYDNDDWDVILENSKLDLEGDEYKSARELVKMANDSNINVAARLSMGNERIEFTDYEELISHLNDYVGENGKYTPLVKAVVLYVNNPLFKELSIVDTPGLNDPIVSRTLRTKEFIEVCDVVFFLTPCSAFLDKSDWTLLSTQLPQKGVKRLTLVGSKFDSGLRDVLRKPNPDDIFGQDPNTADSIQAASILVRKKLTIRTQQKIKEFEEQLRMRGADEEMIRVINGCRSPLFVSAMTQNMANRDVGSYDDEERNVYKALHEFSDNISSDLAAIGNFAAVKDIQSEIVAEKEAILQEKSASFIPTAKTELSDMLYNFKGRAQARAAIISGNDRQQIIVIKNELQTRINNINAELQKALNEWITKVEMQKNEGVRDLRNASINYNKVDERTGTETKTKSYQVKDSKWYKPWTWGRKRTVEYDYDVSYSYIAASDAIENIQRFVRDGEQNIIEIFTKVINHNEMKRRLLNVVAENFDMSDERYDVSLFRSIIELNVSNITFPIIKIDCSRSVNSIASRFNGQVRGYEQEQIKRTLEEAVSSAYEVMAAQFEKAANNYKTSLTSMGDTLRNVLLEDINAEFTSILNSLDEKDRSIQQLTDYVNRLSEVLKGLG